MPYSGVLSTCLILRLMIILSLSCFTVSQYDCEYYTTQHFNVQNESGYIENPGFPGYKVCEEYYWDIIAPRPNDVIIYRWCVIDIETDVECSLDYVVTSAEGYIWRCFPVTELYFHEAIGNFTVMFHSDILENRGGFRLAFCTAPNCRPECPDDILLSHNATGVIKTPNYPDNYPTDTDRCWIMRTAPGYHIRYRFCDFDLEEETYCSFDSVVVNDNGAVCGPLDNRTYNSTPVFHVCFHSDIRITAPGFQLKYCVSETSVDCEIQCDNTTSGSAVGLITDPISTTAEPTTEPLTTEPLTTEPPTTEPPTTEPPTTEPPTTEPPTTEPPTTEPSTTEPSTTEMISVQNTTSAAGGNMTLSAEDHQAIHEEVEIILCLYAKYRLNSYLNKTHALSRIMILVLESFLIKCPVQNIDETIWAMKLQHFQHHYILVNSSFANP